MALADDLVRIADAAGVHGPVLAVLAAEPAAALRLYLVALGPEEARRWIVLDDRGVVVARRDDVRDTASIVALCELAEDIAGGGLDQLRADGVEDAEAAALELERVIGAPPRVASPAYLDAVGAATLVLERALAEVSSPFSEAIRGATGAVDGFVQEVERNYVVELR